MLPVLLFALRRRFVGHFTNADSVIGLTLRILYLVFMALNAGVIGWIIDFSATSGNQWIEPSQLIFIVNGIVCGIWAWLEFFPTYKQRSKLFSKAFPIRFRGQWLANILYDSCTLSLLGTVIPFFILNTVSKTYTNTHFISSLVLLGNTVVFAQLIKAFLESTHRWQWVLLSVWVILSFAIGFATWHWRFQQTILLLILSGSLISQFIFLFLLDLEAAEREDSSFIFKTEFLNINRISPVYIAFINNPKSRKAFAFGMLFKPLFLLVYGKFFVSSNLVMSNFFIMLYVSPVILFTYVANNCWGFFPVLWVTSTLGKRSEQYRIYFQLIAMPVLLDLIITIAILLISKSLNFQIVYYYFIATLGLGLNGLMFSFYKGFYVHKSQNFGQAKNNANGWSILTSTLLVMLLVFSLKTVLTTVLFTISLGITFWYVFQCVLPRDRNIIYRTYESLFARRN